MELEEVIHEFGDMVYRLAYSYCRNKFDADDIFQEVFLKYMKKDSAFESDDHQKAWLIRVTINCAKSELTSFWKRNVVEMKGEITLTDPDDLYLAEILQQLPQKYRIVIHLYYYEGYSTDEISELLGKRPSTIRTQLTRARERLSLLMEEDSVCLKTAIEE
ncbi:MAG: sigma-70 family RNA polymerase sigma factor [Clostridiaceae bacterium]|nr:sigma-70 family RNA polymerase sigma factor [Clostridiaceae bacterium]